MLFRSNDSSYYYEHHMLDAINHAWRSEQSIGEGRNHKIFNMAARGPALREDKLAVTFHPKQRDLDAE